MTEPVIEGVPGIAYATNPTVDCLRKTFEADPLAMALLCHSRVPCNAALVNDPYVIVCGVLAQNRTYEAVGLIGLLNGILDANGLPRVAYMHDDDDSRNLLDFCVYATPYTPTAPIDKANLSVESDPTLECLNQAFAADPVAMYGLINTQVPCSAALTANDHLVHVHRIPLLADGQTLSIFGVINGVLTANGLPMVRSKIRPQEDEMRIEGFERLVFE